MIDLELPVFDVPEIPPKPLPIEAWRALNEDFVRRLKESGLYQRIRDNPMYQPAPEPFRLD